MIENKSIKSRIRVAVTYLLIILAGLLCFFPLWNVVCVSFSSSVAAYGNRVTIYPVDFNFESYKKLLEDMQFWKSFFTSVIRVILGLTINLTLSVLLAYPLSKNSKEFRGRNIYMGLLVFAMLFSGGMVPQYMLMRKMGLLNTVWALVLPGAVPIFNTIMMKNFFMDIPKGMIEAATIDGASPLQILARVVVPCSKPVIATVSLFSIVGHWNDYFAGMLYMTKVKNYPLMTYIQSISINLQEMIERGASDEELKIAAQVSSRSLDSAKIVVAVIPLMLIYPLLQKYLIHGITIGSVKE